MAKDSTPPLPIHDFDEISALGKYKIQRKIGSGGMGAVYLAVDQQLKRTVALKVLPKDKATNQILVRRFKAEGQAGAQLEHPNIVAVYESGEIDGFLYLAMEFVDGVDAYELLRKRGVLPVKRSLEIIKQATLGLQHAHERQVVHRDIKPSNLMIRERDGLVKLADLGLARIIEDDGESGITKAGTTVGTVDYMSPEQAKDSKAADIRSDIYSLGCTWYHLLAGRPPYPDGDLLNKLRAHSLQPVPDPRNLNENIPSGVVAVLQRMMAKKPDDRYQTPAQLLADLSSPALLRGDFSADQLHLLGAAHAASEASASANDDEDDAGPTGASRRRPSTTKPGRAEKAPAARSSRVERDEPEDDADEYDSGPTGVARPRPATSQPGRSGNGSTARPARPARDEQEYDEYADEAPAASQKTKSKSTKATGRESLPARTTSGNSHPPETASGSGQKTKSGRVLPGRIDQPLLSQPPGTFLDPNQIKLGLLILIIAVAIAGIIWSIKRFGDSAGGGLLAANPYANGEVAVVPPEVGAPPGGDPSRPNDPIQITQPQNPATLQPPRPGTSSTFGPPATQPIGNNPSQVLPDFDRTPFGGVIAYAPTGVGTLPGWVWQSRVKVKSERALKIRRSQPAEGEFRNLASALAKVEGNAVFEFADVGPHDIPAFSMKQPGRWTIRGVEGVKPVLIMPAANTPISLLQGTFSLEGVHVILPTERTGPGFRVGSENGPAILTIRRSTLTHLGPLATDIIVAENTGRVVLEDTVLRSCGTCRPVVLRGSETVLVAGQSLLLAGNASAIQIDSHDGLSDVRSVTLVASACLSGQAGLACLHTGKQPPTCQFRLQQSILAYLPGHSADAVGVQFSGWPKASESLERPLVPFVTWTLEKSSLVGWPHWAQLGFSNGAAPVDVPDEAAWRTFWRQEIPTGVLISEGADLRKVQEAGALATSDQIQIGLASLKSQLAEAGPKWSALPEPPQQILAQGIAVGQRSKLAASLETPNPGTSLRYDLKKPNLGKFLNSADCPDGSTVVAFGAGLRTIDPIVIRQKRIQLVFEQAEGVQLVIQPGYRTEPNATSPPAWFSVEDGQLTLSNGTFRMTTSKTRIYPERFLQLTGGLVALRQCRVEGVDAAWPILDMLPSAGHAPPQLLIDKSLIVGMKSLVRVGAAETLLDVRGSVFSSNMGVAVTLDAGSAGSQCSFDSSTLSAAKAAFQVLPVGAGGPVQFFSRASVYQGGGVLSLETDAASVHWWGYENAFATGMNTFLLTKGTTGPQNFAIDWVHHWGEGHELLPVFGANSTLLPHTPSVLAEITPESFQLHADCAAALAGPTGKGLGPLIPQVGPARVAPTTNGSKPAPPVKPQPGVPGF